jgi:flagellar basal-body rod protein FlgF
VRQGSLEASNVNGIEAAVGLIAIQRNAEMLERALSIFHSEFNRIATAELSRV